MTSDAVCTVFDVFIFARSTVSPASSSSSAITVAPCLCCQDLGQGGGQAAVQVPALPRPPEHAPLQPHLVDFVLRRARVPQPAGPQHLRVHCDQCKSQRVSSISQLIAGGDVNTMLDIRLVSSCVICTFCRNHDLSGDVEN